MEKYCINNESLDKYSTSGVVEKERGKNLKLNEVRNELSVRGKNGIGFLFSAIVIWSIITIIFYSQ